MIEDDEIVLSEEEIADLVKLMFYASNGLSVAFSGIFNFIMDGTPSKEDAYNSVDRLAAALRSTIDDMYSESSLTNSRLKDGVRIHDFRPVINTKLN